MDWKKLVGKVAPMLGTALAGPFGGMAGKFLAGKLGVDETELEDVIVNADPDTMFKIKELDASFKLEMKKLGISEDQLHADDRANARKMATDTTLIPQAIIATVFITGFIVVLYVVFKGKINLEGNQLMLANVLLGILSAGVMQIMNFFFGSSSGSKEKTAKLSSKS